LTDFSAPDCAPHPAVRAAALAQAAPCRDVAMAGAKFDSPAHNYRRRPTEGPAEPELARGRAALTTW
jgi:hypothetical protein